MGPISLSKVLNLRPAEWPRVLLLYTMIAIFAAGATWSGATLEAAFLEQVGVGALSWLAIAKGLVAIPAIAVYTAFADRVSNQWLLIAILALGACGIGVGLVLLAFGFRQIAYPWLYLLFFVPLDDIVAAHWFTYVSGFYDTQAAKRIIPLLGTGSSVASIAAGLTLPLLNSWLSPSGLLAVWMGGLVTISFLAYASPYLLREPISAPTRPARRRQPAATRRNNLGVYVDNIREGTGFVLQSPFLRWMMVATFLVVVLLTIMQYQIGRILLAELNDAERIANFLGLVTSVANLIVLPIQLFLLSRIIERLGVGNANLLFPAGMLLISGVLAAVPTLTGAGLAHFGRTRFYAIGYAVDNLLYNAVPLSLKGRSRAFIGGLVTPIALLVGGALLLLIQGVTATWVVSALLILLAMASLLSAVAVRGSYGQALVDMLARDDFSYLLSPDAALIRVADPATVRELRRRLEASTGSEMTILLAKLLSETASPEHIPLLSKIARTHADPRVRAAILDILAASGVHAQASGDLFKELISDPIPAVRIAAINGLDQFFGLNRREFLLSLTPLLDDPETAVRAQVLPAFLSSQPSPYAETGLRLLNTMLDSPVSSERALGLKAIVRAHAAELLPLVVRHLDDPADEVRIEAAVALEALTATSPAPARAPELAVAVRPLVHDRVERVRQVAVVVLGRFAPTDPLLISSLSDTGTLVREAAADALVQTGASVAPALLAELDSGQLDRAAMAAVVLTRIRREQYGSLIETCSANCLKAIYDNQRYLELLAPYSRFPAGNVLRGTLEQQADRWSTTLFYLLGAIHPQDTVQLIGQSLRNPDRMIRANAAEALETLLPPQQAQLIAALCDPMLAPAEKVALGAATWDNEPLDLAEAMRRLLFTDDPWLRAVVSMLLGEIGADLELHSGHAGPSDGRVPVHADRFTDGWLTDREALRSVLLMMEADPAEEVRIAAKTAQHILVTPRVHAGRDITQRLAIVEKVTFLRDVPFFQGMTIEQVRILAGVCEEDRFARDAYIFHEGEPGDSLYVLISGRVGIEQERRAGSSARLATLVSNNVFGEIGLFDQGARGASAIALQECLVLKLRREPLLDLARRYPDLSLGLIRVLSVRLREAHHQIAELMRVRPKKLERLFDQLEPQ